MKNPKKNTTVAFYMRVGNKEQLNFHNEEINEINNRESNEKYAIYIRTNKTECITDFNMKKDELLQFARNNKINVSVIYSDYGCSGKLENRIGLEKMLNDIKSGKINGIIVKKFEQLIRDNMSATQDFLKELKQSGAKLIVISDGKLRDFDTMNKIINGDLFPNEPIYKEIQDFITKKQKEILAERRKRIKER